MFFSKISLQKGLSPRDIVNLTNQNGYQSHQLVWKMFADNPDRKRDFIYRYETVKGLPTFYTVSQRKPDGDVHMWDIRAKNYKPKLVVGQRLEFKLRANPIRTRHDANGKHKRHDVVMEEKLRLKRDQKDFDLSAIVHEEGIKWLDERAKSNGFEIVLTGVRADGYQQHKIFKSTGKSAITLSTVDFSGLLTITDPVIFTEKCLFEGVGPAKGFGCGLMLVKRV